RVEPVHGPLRPVHPPAVAECVRQAIDADVPVVAGAVLARVEPDLVERGVAAIVRQDDQNDGGPVPAEEGEVHTAGGRGDAEREGPAAGGAEVRHRIVRGTGGTLMNLSVRPLAPDGNPGPAGLPHGGTPARRYNRPTGCSENRPRGRGNRWRRSGFTTTRRTGNCSRACACGAGRTPTTT